MPDADQILWTSDERVAQAVAEARKVARKAKERHATIIHNIDHTDRWQWFAAPRGVRVDLRRDRRMPRNTWRIETDA